LRKKTYEFVGVGIKITFENTDYSKALSKLFKNGKITLSWNDDKKDVEIRWR